MDFKSIITNILNKLSFLNKDQTISLTNMTVIIFVSITAFRAAFGGSTIVINGFNWNIQPVDYASALTVLFGLWGYDRKRQAINKAIQDDKQNNNS